TIQLAKDETDASSGTALTITAPAVASHYSLTPIDVRATSLFTGANVAQAGSPANSITLANPGLHTGQAVVYRSVTHPHNSAESIGGLPSDSVYYAIIPNPNNPNTIQLAASIDDARAGRAIGITAPATGTQHSLTPVFSFGHVANLAGDLEHDTFGLLNSASV